MGGKKKGGGGKKGKKKGGDDDGEIDQSQLNEILTAKVQSLKAKLVLEQERRDNSNANVEAMREDGESMITDNETEKGRTKEMVSKMTQIYRQMERQYNEKIDEYEKDVEDQEREKKQLKEEIQSLQQAKEEMITQYEQTIFELKSRIDTMSSDFTTMLKQTLKTMQERIDDANQTYEVDQPGLASETYGGAAGYDEGTPGI